MKKISFMINKDIADHPHFQNKLLKMVAEFDDDKEIFCYYCDHSKFHHVLRRGYGYCRTCESQGKECPCIDNKRFKVRESKQGRKKK